MRGFYGVGERLPEEARMEAQGGLPQREGRHLGGVAQATRQGGLDEPAQLGGEHSAQDRREPLGHHVAARERGDHRGDDVGLLGRELRMPDREGRAVAGCVHVR
jgi:hypothetical protein